MDIAEFLLARIADTVQTARREQAQALTDRRPESPLAAYVLAECEAKRRVVERLARYLADHCSDDWTGDALATDALLDLAQPYADHPAFDPAWRL